MSHRPRIELSAKRIHLDGDVGIRLVGVEPGSEVTLAAELVDDRDTTWRAEARFAADWIGTVDVARDAPLSGSYTGIDPHGMLWSMAPVPPEQYDAFKRAGGEANCRLHALGLPHYDDERPDRVTFTASVGGLPVATATLVRERYPGSVMKTELRDGNLRGLLWQPHDHEDAPGVMLLSGSGGGVSGAAGPLLAAHGLTVLDLAYFNYPDLPDHLVDIPLEYFREGLEWLRARLGHDRIAIQGASRGGEAVLAIAATFPELVTAVVGVVPGDLYALGRNDPGGVKPSWTHGGEPLPLGMSPEEVAALQSYDLSVLESAESLNTKETFFDPWYYQPEVYERTAIPIERIRCPILLVSGADDQCWGSFHNSERAIERLRRKGFRYPHRHLSFEEAGHFLVAPGMPTTMLDSGYHSVLKMPFTMGGTPAATSRAQRGFWSAAIRFYKDVLE